MIRRSLAVLLVMIAGCGSAGVVTDGAPSDRTSARVTRVVDGDTVHVDLAGDDVTVRLIGIDTPEKDGSFTDLECFGDEATRFTTDLLEGRDVALELDVERRDRYDRTLAYVWLDDAMANETIVREGFAYVLTIPPNVRYAERFVEAARDARQADSGLWGSCGTG